MFELRCFKQLPFKSIAEYEEYLKSWSGSNEHSIDKRIDVYILLPPQYADFNKQQIHLYNKNQSNFGLKIRQAKLKLHPLRVKLKGRKLELKMRTKLADNNFELWQKPIQKKMKKEVKLKIWSEVMLRRVEGGGSGDKAILQARKSQAVQQIQLVQSKIQKKLSQTSIFVSQEQVQDEATFWIESEDMQSVIKYLVKVLRHKIEKYKMNDKGLLEYVDALDLVSYYYYYNELLNQAQVDQKLFMAIVEKHQAKSNDGEECMMRLRVVHQKSVDQHIFNEFHQFYVSTSLEHGHPGLQQHDQLLKKWNSKFGVVLVGDKNQLQQQYQQQQQQLINQQQQQQQQQQGEDQELKEEQFIGGYPEFLSQFAKISD